VGGAEKLAFAINDYLTRETGIRAGLLVPDRGETLHQAEKLHTPYRTYRLEALGSQSLINASRENFRLSLMDWNRNAILHFHSPFVYGSARLMRKWTRLRSIVHIHLDYPEDQLRWPLKDPPTTLIGCAAYVLRNPTCALGKRLARTELRTLLNAIDMSRFRPPTQYRERHRRPDEPVIITMLANIAPHKGQHTAISTVKLIHDQGIPVELWLAGEERGSSTHTLRLKRQADTLGIANKVKFLGFRLDIVQLLEKTDYLVLPSTNEGLPLSLLEAQAAGVITLASPTAGIPELITDKENGFLIEADDYQRYASQIMTLIRSPNLRRDVRANAWTRLQAQHEITHYFQQIASIYGQALRN
jgi:glycosyltransferase involved in cell wall biosynthesis